MRTTDLFTVDGKPMPVPDGDLPLYTEDLEAPDSGRDESGVLHRFVLRRDVPSWEFSYDRLTREAYAYLEGLFAGKDSFRFGYVSALDGTRQEIVAHRGKCSVLWHSAADGQFRNCRFRITAC